MKNKMLKTFVAVILSLSFVLSFAACSFDGSSGDSVKEDLGAGTSEEIPVKVYDYSDSKVGDYIKLGLYEQDDNVSNGKEEIEWLVLDIQGDKALIISKYALDSQSYHKEFIEVTWETSTLRHWLNNDFLNSAFSNSEQGRIVATTVTNTNSNNESINDTQDRIFLLSKYEASQYFSSDEERKCAPTIFAANHGVRQYENYTADGEGCCYWWLRSPGIYNSWAAGVGSSGIVGYRGNNVKLGYNAVRPAMWITIG
ncbi:MAG: hypothetical protein IK955_07910 [Clostridia bacterium]|nr:hypothetical protein [Clostridia bacterium]